ncbi:kinase [Striga asiatica]|uniref:Kinase n=1 Tax=Striga asiatica TaxID=4170 RepID=A0A5A7NXT8_STRAF|nr:kinase [Striga asiatica]
MIFIFHQLIIIYPIISLVALSSPTSTAACVQNCAGIRVPYPFGFTDGCSIKLDCSAAGDIRISDFRVRNLTADRILVDLPADCGRPIGDLRRLFGGNFSPTWRNGLLLGNCTVPSNDCPVGLVTRRIGRRDCDWGPGNANISCYWGGISENASDFLDLGKIGGCGVLFSSVAVDLGESVSGVGDTSSIALDLWRVELGWWVNGTCDGCHRNANCTAVRGTGEVGFRCDCNEGFAGDGFSAGEGCRRVSHCSASRYISGRCGNKVGILILVGVIITGASLLAALTATLYYLKRRRRQHHSNLKTRVSAKHLLASTSPTIPFYPYKEIERASNNFSDKNRLGTGAYGTVYAGKLHNGDWVAIKKIRHRDQNTIQQVMNEIRLLSSVSHPNLVRLLGFCIDHGEHILVYEYMPNGTLAQHLQRERGSILPWTVRLTIASETARAIAHLHSTPIFHRDIKSSNILLDYDFKSKVADFGLSRFGLEENDSHISTAPQGTPGYVDPQYHQNFHLSDKSDVYSFGVVLVEIITAMRAVDFSRPCSEVNLAALAADRIGKGRVDEIVDRYLEPNRDAWTLSSIHRVAELAFRCLAFQREGRPSMAEVADELEQIRRSGWATMEDGVMGSSTSSSGSDKSSLSGRRIGIGSKRVMVSRISVGATVKEEEEEDCSPVSVQEVWFSEQSSPSTNSLLSNVVK